MCMYVLENQLNNLRILALCVSELCEYQAL